MKVVQAKAQIPAPDEGPLFVGKVTRMALCDQGALRVTEVSFAAGARTKLHTHSTDQVLIISTGDGLVGTPDERHAVVPGDVVFISADEPHYHGAAPGRDMAHYSLLGPGQKTKILE